MPPPESPPLPRPDAPPPDAPIPPAPPAEPPPPASPPPDAPDGADILSKIEEANIANILAKLHAGKVLGDREEKRLKEYQERKAALAAGALAAAEIAAGADKVADSMESASALSGIPRDILKRAKEAGCPAFRGSRVYIAELVDWMAEHGDTLPTGNAELDAINLAIAKEKLRKQKFANDVEEGRYIRRADQAAQILALGLELKRVLRRELEELAPDRQAQRTRDEILPINRAIVDRICTQFQEDTARWSHPTEIR